MNHKTLLIAGTLCLAPLHLYAQNYSNASFEKAKNILIEKVYTDHFQTLYCKATFDPKTKEITEYPDGFDETVLAERAKKIEFEHVVPAENFGRFFKEWREGNPLCVDKKGKSYKGRKCAQKINILYGLMEADMYNLYPAIGSVNAVRSNFNFTELPENIPSTFGSCTFKIADKKAEPPEDVKGIIARTTLYFESAYTLQYKLSSAQRKLMQSWSEKHPVTIWECLRASRIEAQQFSENKIVKQACKKAKLWPEDVKGD